MGGDRLSRALSPVQNTGELREMNVKNGGKSQITPRGVAGCPAGGVCFWSFESD